MKKSGTHFKNFLALNFVGFSGFFISAVGTLFVLKFTTLEEFGSIALGTVLGLFFQSLIDGGFLASSPRILGTLEKTEAIEFMEYSFNQRIKRFLILLIPAFGIIFVFFTKHHLYLLAISYLSTSLLVLSSDVYFNSKALYAKFIRTHFIPRIIFGTIGLISIVILKSPDVYVFMNLLFAIVNIVSGRMILSRHFKGILDFRNKLNELDLALTSKTRISNDFFNLIPSIAVAVVSPQLQSAFSSVERVVSLKLNLISLPLYNLNPWVFQSEKDSYLRLTHVMKLSYIFSIVFGSTTIILLTPAIRILTGGSVLISIQTAIACGLIISFGLISRMLVYYRLIPFGKTRRLIQVNLILGSLQTISLFLIAQRLEFSALFFAIAFWQFIYITFLYKISK